MADAPADESNAKAGIDGTSATSGACIRLRPSWSEACIRCTNTEDVNGAMVIGHRQFGAVWAILEHAHR
jgi:hypothetical protein